MKIERSNFMWYLLIAVGAVCVIIMGATTICSISHLFLKSPRIEQSESAVVPGNQAAPLNEKSVCNFGEHSFVNPGAHFGPLVSQPSQTGNMDFITDSEIIRKQERLAELKKSQRERTNSVPPTAL
jgi:hypothetical protein